MTRKINKVKLPDEKRKAISRFRRQVSLLATKANKRIARLEKNNLTDSPAYQRLIKDGLPKFGIKGKTYNEVRQELSRINRFLDSTTSTIGGVRTVLVDMAKNTGISYSNFNQLKEKASKFFELSNKVEQYLRHMHSAGSAFGYQQIWEAIDVYIQNTKRDLDQTEFDLDKAIESISNALLEYNTPDVEELFYGKFRELK